MYNGEQIIQLIQYNVEVDKNLPDWISKELNKNLHIEGTVGEPYIVIQHNEKTYDGIIVRYGDYIGLTNTGRYIAIREETIKGTNSELK